MEVQLLNIRDKYYSDYKVVADSSIKKVILLSALSLVFFFVLYFISLINLIIGIIAYIFLVIIFYLFLNRKCPVCGNKMNQILSYKQSTPSFYVCHTCKTKVEINISLSDTG